MRSKHEISYEQREIRLRCRSCYFTFFSFFFFFDSFIMNLWPQNATYNNVCRPSSDFGTISFFTCISVLQLNTILGSAIAIRCANAWCVWLWTRIHSGINRKMFQSRCGMQTAHWTVTIYVFKTENSTRRCRCVYNFLFVAFSLLRCIGMHCKSCEEKRFFSSFFLLHLKCFKLHASLVCVFCCNGFTINYYC